MANKAWIVICACLVSLSVAAAEDKGPRTGFHQKKMTIIEAVGEKGAAAMSSVLEADDEISWKIYVPTTYDPGKPAGVIVFLTHKGSWGGSKRAYNPALDQHNLIWAGLTGVGDKSPMNERMMKAIITPTALAKEYALDPERVFIGGFSGGAHIAMILATAKPELFKGGLFVGGALFWEDREPPKLDLVRQNRYVFVTGSNDPFKETVRKTALAYQDAGVANAELIVMPNEKQEMPGRRVLERVIMYLDDALEAE